MGIPQDAHLEKVHGLGQASLTVAQPGTGNPGVGA